MNMTKRQVLFDALKYSLITAPISYLAFFIDAGINSYSTDITGQFFNAVIENQYNIAQGLLGKMLFTLMICVVILPMVVLGTNILFFYFSIKYDYKVTSAFFEKKYERMREFSSGMIVQRLFRDPGQLLMLLVTIPSKALAQISALVFMAILMFRLSPQLGVVCIGFGVLGAVCPLVLKRKLARLDEASKRLNDRTAGIELEIVTNRNFFINYEIEDLYMQRQEEVYNTYFQEELKKGVKMDAVAAVLPEVCLLMGKIAFLLIGVVQVSKGNIGAGNLVAFFTYLTLVVSLITQIYNQTRQMVQLPDSLDRIWKLVKDKENLGGNLINSDWKSIRAKNLMYQYTKDSPAVTYEEFVIKRNELVEIQGANGTGKTTLVLLLSGLQHPSSGTITIDDQSIETLALEDWWNHISIVEQMPTIFPGTVRENIRIANLNADNETVDRMIEMVNLKEIEEREIVTAQQLSGGELKRVSLGRALLRNAELVVFDEPFEHLDQEGRPIIEKMLKDTQKTRILIQHHREVNVECNKVIKL